MNIVDQLTSFVREIGLQVFFESIETDTFLPGIRLRNGTIIIDRQKLLYPGDILHEAGHLAVMPPNIRSIMSDNLDGNPIHQGGEMMAIAWSYAACIHLNIDPHIVFHEMGYKDDGRNIVENFSEGRYFGVPMLQWNNMTYDDKRAKELDAKPFPHMISWLCLKNKYKVEV